MTYSVRPVEPTQIELLLDMMQHYYKFDGLPFDRGTALAAVSDLIRTPALGSLWFIAQDGAVVGYAVLVMTYGLEYGGRVALVDELFVEEGHRGQGLGTATLEFLEKHCASMGVQVMRLEVEKKNQRARAIYQRYGFKEHDRYLMAKRVSMG